MPGKIHLERLMHRNSVSVGGESVAGYALLKLIPNGDSAAPPLPLNLGLVLDVSGSMYEEDGIGSTRLGRVQNAIPAALGKLAPEDRLAIVAFAYTSQVILPSTKLAERTRIEEAIGNIDRLGIDPGGTALDQGMQLALAELKRVPAPSRLSQLIVLTDGQTLGEQSCLELAEQARQENIRLTFLAVGTEWNADLIKDLARRSEGKWRYIDIQAPQEAERVFLGEFEDLACSGFADVEIHVRPTKDVRLKRFRQVAPEIKELSLARIEERHLVAGLGSLARDKMSRYILDLSLPRRPDGKYVLAQVEVSYDLGAGNRETTGQVPLEITYAGANGHMNAEVAKHIDEVQIYELNNNLQEALAANNHAEAQRVAENIANKGQLMGAQAAKKTKLAKQVLHELNYGGRVSKKTQLALDDAVRLVEERPEPPNTASTNTTNPHE